MSQVSRMLFQRAFSCLTSIMNVKFQNWYDHRKPLALKPSAISPLPHPQAHQCVACWICSKQNLYKQYPCQLCWDDKKIVHIFNLSHKEFHHTILQGQSSKNEQQKIEKSLHHLTTSHFWIRTNVLAPCYIHLK